MQEDRLGHDTGLSQTSDFRRHQTREVAQGIVRWRSGLVYPKGVTKVDREQS
jgi:hypothetical protein